METTQEILLDLNPEKMEEIVFAINNQLAKVNSALKDKAAAQADAAMYGKLIDYLTGAVKTYMDDPENLKQVLTNPKNIETAYAALTGSEDFKALCAKEYGQMPRVIAMLVLAGSQAHAADTAMQLVDKPEEKRALDVLADLYQGYMKDAASYGKGEDKKVAVQA